MNHVLHQQTFDSYGAGVLAVECWTADAARDGRRVGELFAVIDALNETRVHATLASRVHLLVVTASFGAVARELQIAVKNSPADRLWVFTVGAGRCQAAPIDELAPAIRKIRSTKGDA